MNEALHCYWHVIEREESLLLGEQDDREDLQRSGSWLACTEWVSLEECV